MSRKYLLDGSANGAKWADDVQFLSHLSPLGILLIAAHYVR